MSKANDNTPNTPLIAAHDPAAAGKPEIPEIPEASTSAKSMKAGVCTCCGKHKASCECACCGKPKAGCEC